jgi:hypothetical protein
MHTDSLKLEMHTDSLKLEMHRQFKTRNAHWQFKTRNAHWQFKTRNAYWQFKTRNAHWQFKTDAKQECRTFATDLFNAGKSLRTNIQEIPRPWGISNVHYRVHKSLRLDILTCILISQFMLHVQPVSPSVTLSLKPAYGLQRWCYCPPSLSLSPLPLVQACPTFHMMREISTKFGLHAGNVEFGTQNG